MKYKIKNEYLEVEINSFGAELCSMKKVSEDIEYIWQGDPSYWKRHSPILFPIVGKLIDNTYTYNEETYHMTQHGFARDYEFELVEDTPTSLVFMLESNIETLKLYPFSFRLYLSYTLEDSGLIVGYKVVNKSIDDMLFSIGAHPAFNWPLAGGSKEDYYFELKGNSLHSLKICDKGISKDKYPVEVEDNKIWLTEGLFINDALIFDDLKEKAITLKNRIDDLFVEMKFNDFPYLALWSKPTGAPFVCIEPWCGIADFDNHDQKFENKEGLIKLESKEVFTTSYIINI